MPFSFDNLPVTTLIGADSKTFDCVTEGINIDKVEKFRATKLGQRLLSPLYRLNDSAYQHLDTQEIKAPIFIIGHWRSGTTFAHNLLSRDMQFGYCTTYQTVFPHLMLRGRSIMSHIAALAMPTSRPKDKAVLSISQPQEEEFAIANMTHAAYYHALIFPQLMGLYREKYLLFNGSSEQDIGDFCSATTRVIRTALHCQGKSRFLSKNPPHTARIPILLSMFPDAKFIYIFRNKGDVLRSTKEFFRQTTDAVALQNISTQQLDYEIVKTYDAVIDKYEQDRILIPEGSLCEVSFEHLTSHPQSCVEMIYKRLGLKMR